MIVSWILDDHILYLGSWISDDHRSEVPGEEVVFHKHVLDTLAHLVITLMMLMLMLIMVVMKCQPRYLAVSQAAPSRRTVGRRTGTKIIFSNNYN